MAIIVIFAYLCTESYGYPYPYPAYLVQEPLTSLSVRPLYRIVRDAPSEFAARPQRQAGGGGGDHHDVVDYGAHTGHHGAFGWYADFPVLVHH